jgi:hypothetical protein
MKLRRTHFWGAGRIALVIVVGDHGHRAETQGF